MQSVSSPKLLRPARARLALDDPEVAGFLAVSAGWPARCPSSACPPSTRTPSPVSSLPSPRKTLFRRFPQGAAPPVRRRPLLGAAASLGERSTRAPGSPERHRSASSTSPAGAAGPPRAHQELSGLAETPRSPRRAPVLLHSPRPNGGRPQQVTHELRSFWENLSASPQRVQGRSPSTPAARPWNARPERRPGRGRSRDVSRRDARTSASPYPFDLQLHLQSKPHSRAARQKSSISRRESTRLGAGGQPAFENLIAADPGRQTAGSIPRSRATPR